MAAVGVIQGGVGSVGYFSWGANGVKIKKVHPVLKQNTNSNNSGLYEQCCLFVGNKKVAKNHSQVNKADDVALCCTAKQQQSQGKLLPNKLGASEIGVTILAVYQFKQIAF